jgi:predicted Zn-dependent peptidase
MTKDGLAKVRLAIIKKIMECTFFMVYLKPSTSENLLTEIDAEIVKLQTELISDKELQKLQNKYENQYVNSNASIEGVASNLATYYALQ